MKLKDLAVERIHCTYGCECFLYIYFSMRVVYYYIAFYELVLVSCTNLLLITLYFLYNKICSIQNQKKKIFPLFKISQSKSFVFKAREIEVKQIFIELIS